MENPTILSPNSNGRRRSSASNSPEFEFWMIRNPSCPETTLHSADELFSGGILLPLQLLNSQNADDPPDKNTTTEPTSPPSISRNPNNIPGSDLRSKSTASRRWKDIFRKNPESKEKEKKKKKERNGGSGGGGGGTNTAELNINLWPFSRSRSAGNGGGRPRTAVGNRKVSSAPCSRSNSTGESKYRKCPSSPSRAGVHLGRSSPVWQVKRSGPGRSSHDNPVRITSEKGARRSQKSTAGGDATGAGAKTKVLNLNVPACVGYRQRMSCRSDVVQENSTGRVAGGNADVAPMSAGVGTGGEGAASSLFNLRSLFTKKVF